MTAAVLTRLTCDRPGCGETYTAPAGLAGARVKAHTHGWTIRREFDGTVDYCPAHPGGRG